MKSKFWELFCLLHWKIMAEMDVEEEPELPQETPENADEEEEVWNNKAQMKFKL